MLIRLAEHRDVEAVMCIVYTAQEALRELGIDQWQNGYPSADVIAEDIANGVGYVACTEEGKVIGYEAVVLTGEEAYAQIADDRWHTSNKYVVVHRLCVHRDSRRSGIAIELIRFAEEHALKHGISDFRIDTHEGNIRMLAMLNKLGFEHVGTIRYDSGLREAFDLKISSK